MERLHEYLEDCKRFSKEGFAKAHPNPCLVITVVEESGDKWRAFRTTSVDGRSLAKRAEYPFAADAYRVLKITKTADNPWRNRISVGRARNNDMVIRDRSVSKLHAHFNLEADGRTTLSDAGSRNGTRINGQKIEGTDGIAVTPGDEVRIGRVDAIYYDAEHFFDFLDDLLDT